MARPLSFEQLFTSEGPILTEEFCSAERVLARLVAAAFAADHPELFGARHPNVNIMASRREGPLIPKGQHEEGTTTAGETYDRTE